MSEPREPQDSRAADQSAPPAWQQRLQTGLNHDVEQLDPTLRQRLAQARQHALRQPAPAPRQFNTWGAPWGVAAAIAAMLLAVVLLPRVELGGSESPPGLSGNPTVSPWDDLSLLVQDDFPLIALPSSVVPTNEVSLLDEAEDELAFYSWVELELNASLADDLSGSEPWPG